MLPPTAFKLWLDSNCTPQERIIDSYEQLADTQKNVRTDYIWNQLA